MNIELNDGYRDILDFLKIYFQQSEEYVENGWKDVSDENVLNELLHSFLPNIKGLNVVFKCPECEDSVSLSFKKVFECSDEWGFMAGAYCEKHKNTEMKVYGFEKIKRFMKDE
ncbi:MAG: hypothetical protein R6V04_16710 [bacterium]